jgi:N-acetylglucosamine malate deacetylase 1
VLFQCLVTLSLIFAAGASGERQPTTPPTDGKLRIIVFGAHPDDAEYKAGGVAAMWAALGHHVKFVSMTNGDQGHYEMSGGALARRRKAEVEQVAKGLGIDQTVVLDNPDEFLMPSAENRRTMIHLIREWQADVVIAHRPYDYNPDHRYVGVLAQDSAFVVTVPFVDLNSPPCERNPVFLYTSDRFTKPIPFRADIAVATDEVFERKVKALHAMTSQLYEGYLVGRAREERFGGIPTDDAGRLNYLMKRQAERDSANPYREALAKWYGAEKAKVIRYAEAFEICEYGRIPTEADIRTLFPFLPAR